MNQFLDPKNDYAFKRLFGVENHKRILIRFLNDMFEGAHPHIEDVEYLKTAQDPEIAVLRSSIIDVLCKDITGRQWIIEMQYAYDTHFLNRAQAYACRVYLNQRKKPETGDKKATDYGDMKPVIFLAILDKTLFPNKPDYLSHHKQLDIKTFECDIEGLSFSFLELEKLNKERRKLGNMIEKWIHFLKHAEFTKPNELEEIRKDTPIIGEAYDALSRYAFTPEELLEYEKYDMARDAEMTRISDAEAKGEAKGKAEGRADIARSMLKDGMDISVIIKYTGLNEEQIQELGKS